MYNHTHTQTGRLMRHAVAALGTALLASTAGLSQVLAQAEIPAIHLTFADFSTPLSVGGVSATEYIKRVAELSGGKITIEYFPSASVLSPAEQAGGIASGTADMGPVFTPYTPADFPLSNWAAELGTLPKGGVPFSQMVGALAQTEFVRTNPDYIREMSGQGLHVIGSSFSQAFDLLCNKPVKTLADAAGKRIRVGGQVWALESQAIGMTPVPLGPTEVYEGFSRGIVDCLNLQPMVYLDLGLLDVPGTKYYVPLEFTGWNTAALAFTKSRWDSFPQAAKDVLTDAFSAYLEATVRENYARHTTFAKMTQGEGIELTQPAEDLVNALEEYHKQNLANLPSRAPANLAHPAKLIADFTALQEKWRGLVEAAGYTPAPADVNERMTAYQQPIDLSSFVEMMDKELSALP